MEYRARGAVFADWEVRQYYMRNTNVLVTSFTGIHDAFEIIDFMPRFEAAYLSFIGQAQIARIVKTAEGDSGELCVRCKPRFDYGKEAAERADWNSLPEIRFDGPEQTLFFETDAPISYILHETAFELKESKHFSCFLTGKDSLAVP